MRRGRRWRRWWKGRRLMWCCRAAARMSATTATTSRQGGAGTRRTPAAAADRHPLHVSLTVPLFVPLLLFGHMIRSPSRRPWSWRLELCQTRALSVALVQETTQQMPRLQRLQPTTIRSIQPAEMPAVYALLLRLLVWLHCRLRGRCWGGAVHGAPAKTWPWARAPAAAARPAAAAATRRGRRSGQCPSPPPACPAPWWAPPAAAPPPRPPPSPPPARAAAGAATSQAHGPAHPAHPPRWRPLWMSSQVLTLGWVPCCAPLSHTGARRPARGYGIERSSRASVAGKGRGFVRPGLRRRRRERERLGRDWRTLRQRAAARAIQ